jgi:hypothetical protein
VIDRIGEMVAAIEAGEEFPAGNDDALIGSLEPAPRPLLPHPPTPAMQASSLPVPHHARSGFRSNSSIE